MSKPMLMTKADQLLVADRTNSGHTRFCQQNLHGVNNALWSQTWSFSFHPFLTFFYQTFY